MKPISIFGIIMTFANQLRFKNLFFLVAGLLILDLLIPDMVPLLDEIILGLLTVMLANMKKTETNDIQKNNKEGEIIEGEILEEKRDKQV